MQSKPINRYQQIIEKIFFDNYKPGDTAVQFDRTDLTKATAALKLETIKNLGDAIYAMRYRTPLPKKILKTQPKEMEWVIEGTGRSKYAFKLVRLNRIKPNPELVTIKIPDSTPEIIGKYSLSDEHNI